VLCSLVKQLLACPGKSILPPLEELYHTCVTRNSRPDSVQLTEIFKGLSEQFSSIYLVFDAFDECDKTERPLIVDMIRKLAEVPNTKILVTGRPHQNFLEASSMTAARSFEIKAHEQDVQRYLSKELENVRHLLSERIRNRISESLQNNIDGTYVYHCYRSNFK
jgi:hypothetical protein